MNNFPIRVLVSLAVITAADSLSADDSHVNHPNIILCMADDLGWVN